MQDKFHLFAFMIFMLHEFQLKLSYFITKVYFNIKYPLKMNVHNSVNSFHEYKLYQKNHLSKRHNN